MVLSSSSSSNLCPFGDQSWSSGRGSIFLVVRKKNRVTMGVGDDINDMGVGDDYNIFLQFACLRTSQLLLC